MRSNGVGFPYQNKQSHFEIATEALSTLATAHPCSIVRYTARIVLQVIDNS